VWIVGSLGSLHARLSLCSKNELNALFLFSADDACPSRVVCIDDVDACPAEYEYERVLNEYLHRHSRTS
jgi:hypothetical protein